MASTLTVVLSNPDAVRQVARVGEIGLADGSEVAADDEPPARLASSCDTLVGLEQDVRQQLGCSSASSRSRGRVWSGRAAWCRGSRSVAAMTIDPDWVVLSST